MEELTKEEIEIFEKLITLNKKILKLYEQLVNKPDEYEKIIDYLSICLDLENDLYKKLDYSKTEYYLEYLNLDFFKNKFDYDIAISMDLDKASIKRIYTIIMTKENDDIIKNIENNDYSTEDVHNSLILARTIDEDFKRLFAFFLDDLIKQEPNEEFKVRLAKIKYLIYFLNPNLEKELIFKEEKTFINTFLTADILNANLDDTKKLIITYIIRNLKKYLVLLINTKDEDYQDKDKYFNTLVYEALIKAWLEMSYTKINFSKYKDTDTNNEKSKNIIQKIVKNRNTYGIIKLRTERIKYESSK